MRIGILSDTHTGRPLDDLGPGPGEFLASVDLIVHTGDVTGPLVLDWMEQFGPLIVNRGNHDAFDDPRLEDVVVLEREGWRMGMAHIVLDHRHRGEERVEHLKRRGYGDSDLQILIAGDTHYERLEYENHTLIINSGSLTLPHNQTVRLGSVVLLEVTRDGVHAEIIPLGETEGLKNPTLPAHVDVERGGRLVSASYNGQAIELSNGTLHWPGVGPRDQM